MGSLYRPLPPRAKKGPWWTFFFLGLKVRPILVTYKKALFCIVALYFDTYLFKTKVGLFNLYLLEIFRDKNMLRMMILLENNNFNLNAASFAHYLEKYAQ